MTRDEVVTVILDVLKRSDQSTKALNSLDLFQVQLEKGPVLPWFLLSEMSYVTTTAGEERIQVPADYLRGPEEDGVAALWYYDSTATTKWNPLTPYSRYDKLKYEYGSVTSATAPKGYSLLGDYFRVLPVGASGFTLYMVYYQAQTLPSALGASETNGWTVEAPELLIGGAGEWLAARLRDWEALAFFKEQKASGYQALIVADEARKQGALSDLAMGDFDVVGAETDD